MLGRNIPQGNGGLHTRKICIKERIMVIKVTFTENYSQVNFTFADSQKAFEFVETALSAAGDGFSANNSIEKEKGEEENESL
jgi:hypothetical protein